MLPPRGAIKGFGAANCCSGQECRSAKGENCRSELRRRSSATGNCCSERRRRGSERENCCSGQERRSSERQICCSETTSLLLRIAMSELGAANCCSGVETSKLGGAKWVCGVGAPGLGAAFLPWRGARSPARLSWRMSGTSVPDLPCCHGPDPGDGLATPS
jgi:hypothetical protein